MGQVAKVPTKGPNQPLKLCGFSWLQNIVSMFRAMNESPCCSQHMLVFNTKDMWRSTLINRLGPPALITAGHVNGFLPPQKRLRKADCEVTGRRKPNKNRHQNGIIVYHCVIQSNKRKVGLVWFSVNVHVFKSSNSFGKHTSCSCRYQTA